MTTSVVIRTPSPNHQDVMVQKQSVDAEGRWTDVGPPMRLTWGMSLSEFVFGGRRLVVTETTREAPPA
jgi:hypothetical protein